jgi:hypothetical protein
MCACIAKPRPIAAFNGARAFPFDEAFGSVVELGRTWRGWLPVHAALMGDQNGFDDIQRDLQKKAGTPNSIANCRN